MTYTGDKPFTGGALTRIVKKDKRPFPWTHWTATENWAALVGDDDWGLGIWKPGNYAFVGGFAGKPGKGGTKDNPTGYISPLQSEIMDHDIEYEYEYVLILGTLKEIRQYVYDHAEKKPPPPDFLFEKSREHWHFMDARDQGWRPRGELHLDLEGNDPQIVSPTGFWRAEDAPKLYLRAAFATKQSKAQLFWRGHGDGGFSGEKYVGFDIEPDGKYRTYEIDLASFPLYKGAIIRYRLDPVPSAEKGEFVKIRFLSVRKEGDR